jgi:hypothetical protein
MSEALFIAFMLLTLWSLAEFLNNGKQWLLIISGLLAALSVLTRYVGFVLVPVAGLALLLFGPAGAKAKLKNLLVFGAASLVPVGLWLLRNQLVGSNAVDRQVGLHLMSQTMRGELVDRVLSWFYLTHLGLPWRVRVPLFALLFVAILVWFVIKDGWFVGKRSTEIQPLRALPYMLAVLLPVYVFTIWANTSILDPNTTIQAIKRYLTPAFVSTMILVVCIACRLIKGARINILAVAVSVLLGVGLTGYYAGETKAYLLRGDNIGYGYTDNIRYWPAEIAMLKGLNPDRPIVTNDPQLLYALCERYSYPLPLTASETGASMVDAGALQARLADGAYLVILWRYGQTEADVFDVSLAAGYPGPAHTGYVVIYSDPAYTP